MVNEQKECIHENHWESIFDLQKKFDEFRDRVVTKDDFNEFKKDIKEDVKGILTKLEGSPMGLPINGLRERVDFLSKFFWAFLIAGIGAIATGAVNLVIILTKVLPQLSKFINK